VVRTGQENHWSLSIVLVIGFKLTIVGQVLVVSLEILFQVASSSELQDLTHTPQLRSISRQTQLQAAKGRLECVRVALGVGGAGRLELGDLLVQVLVEFVELAVGCEERDSLQR